MKQNSSKKNSTKKNNLINNNRTSQQFRNNSTNNFNEKDLYKKILPKINTNKIKYESKLTDSNMKSSTASTFYSVNESSKRLLTDIKQDKNLLKYIISKQKSYLKKKKKLEINPSYFIVKPSKNKDIDLFIKEDYNNMNKNKDYDYSNLIKKLDRWDEDNCLVKNNDKITLYNILNKFYKKKNMTKELKNLNTMESLLKSKTDYDKLCKDRLDYKNNENKVGGLSTRKSKVMLNIASYNFKNGNKKYLNNNNKQELEIDDIKLLSEKIKYEAQLRHDLIFVNNILYNKKLLKAEKSNKLEELYKAKAELKQSYDKNYNYNMKDYWNRYEEYEQRYKKLENLISNQNSPENEKIKETAENSPKKEKKIKTPLKETKDEEKDIKEQEDNKEEKENKEDIDPILESNKKSSLDVNYNEFNEPSPTKKNRRKSPLRTEIRRSVGKRYTVSQMKFIKEMNFIKATKINTINFEMKTKIEKLRIEYQKKIKELNELQVTLEEEIHIIKNELSYYKQVNEELIREYRNYYLRILKKGNDHRKEGLVWVVKNLLELQINLEYQHFPKYLTHEHIDYLIELAHLLLEQSELIIIIKVLRKKQTTSYIDENIQTYNMLDKYMKNHIKDKMNRRSLIGDINALYGKNMLGIINEIDKRFEKVYNNNREIVKNYLEKNEEELKLRNALEHIKKGLYNSDKFIKENQGSILDAFIGNSKNKDFFSFILKIRNRLNQLEVIIANLIKKEKDSYTEQIQKYNSTTKNFDINFYKEVIKKSLFGEKFDIYD